MTQQYRNPPTVVVVAASTSMGLVLVRRLIEPGVGKLCLPGGYQEMGETWQEAAARELKEETGYVVDPESVVLADLRTVEDGTKNLLLCYVEDALVINTGSTDGEGEVEIHINAPDEYDVAFEIHNEWIASYFDYTGA